MHLGLERGRPLSIADAWRKALHQMADGKPQTTGEGPHTKAVEASPLPEASEDFALTAMAVGLCPPIDGPIW